MTAKHFWLTGALLFWASCAGASGYDAYIDLATATTYTSTCSATGSDHGRTVPRCIATGVGDFYFPISVRSDASNALTIALSAIEIINVNNHAAANMCVKFSCYVVSAGTDITAAMTAATDTAELATAIGSSCNGTSKACISGATAAVACRNVQTAADCSGSACTNRQAWGRIKWVGCTAGVSGSNNFDFPWAWLSIQ